MDHLGILSIITTERSAHLPNRGAGGYPELQTLVLRMPKVHKGTQQQEFQDRGGGAAPGALALSGFLCRDAGVLLAPYRNSGNETGNPTGHISACVPLTGGGTGDCKSHFLLPAKVSPPLVGGPHTV